MTRVAFVFPGQGTQTPGMGSKLFERSPIVREYFQRADEALGHPLSQLCLHGPQEQLTLTEHAQPAILTLSCAIAALVEAETDLKPSAAAGLSLGEYSALVTAGMLAFEDAVRLVARRGKYMQETVAPGVGGMAAIFGLEAAAVEDLCLAIGDVEPANYNCPGQLVVSGYKKAVAALVEAATEAGARRAYLLEVSAPFHCSLLQPAADKLQADLAQVTFRAPRFPVLSGVDLSEITPHNARRLLAHQVISPVRWQQCVEELTARGVEVLIETGPGKVLCGLARRINRGLRALNIEEPDDLSTVKEELQC